MCVLLHLIWIYSEVTQEFSTQGEVSVKQMRISVTGCCEPLTMSTDNVGNTTVVIVLNWKIKVYVVDTNKKSDTHSETSSISPCCEVANV